MIARIVAEQLFDRDDVRHRRRSGRCTGRRDLERLHLVAGQRTVTERGHQRQADRGLLRLCNILYGGR